MLNTLRRLIDPTPNEKLPDGPSLPISAMNDPRVLTPSTLGSGAFGKWQIDADGLPAYHYEMDQYSDPRARFQNSLGLDRRDHWYAIGNDRITALAGNDGTIQFYMADRGGVFLNRFDDGSGPDDWTDGQTWLPEPIRAFIRRVANDLRDNQLEGTLKKWRATHPAETSKVRLADEIQDTLTQGAHRPIAPEKHIHYAGGFSYLDDNTDVWATAYRYRPKGAQSRRIFGMGYYETETTYRDIRAVRRVYAPPGDDSLLIADIYLRNLGDHPVTFKHYEFWDVNQHQLTANWFQTGLSSVSASDAREALNAQFIQRVDWDADHSLLRAQLTSIAANAPAVGEVSRTDYYPFDTFLIDLEGKADAAYTDKLYFFGEDGTPEKPMAVKRRAGSRLLDESSALNQPFCLVQRREITLQPNEIKQLRYAYGAAKPGDSLDWVAKYRTSSGQAVTETLKNRLAWFSTGANPELSREMAWHSYALQINSVYNEYFNTHTIAQGSAYLYMHGFDGAPRDLAFFVMPMVYLRPDLARDTLKMIMSVTKADTGIMTYGFSGHGVLDSAVLHKKPSDLDLFFLLAIVEYLAATGDFEFLKERVAFYPAGEIAPGAQSDTVLDHIRAAFFHLEHGIGIGDNGLIKVGDGDWSDSVVIENAAQRVFLGVSFGQSVEHGESIPNTQMALYVLPLAAALLEAYDHELVTRMRAFVAPLHVTVNKQLNERWYTRAILRDAVNQQVPIDKYQINLEAQVWALIGGLTPNAAAEELLVNAIDGVLESPVGSRFVERGGQISAAIGQLLTWGYSRSRPDLAWRSLQRLSFANHAAYFPDVWYGIWTAPDSMNPVDDARYPGGTWVSPVTPMTDFPAMNSNPHAMSLLALIRLAGIEPLADGLRIAPRLPKEAFILDLPLIKIAVDQDGIDGVYRAQNDGTRTLYIEIPPEMAAAVVTVDGHALTDLEPFGGYVRVPIKFVKGQSIAFNVRWGAAARSHHTTMAAQSARPLAPTEAVRL